MGKRIEHEDGTVEIIGKAANGQASIYTRKDGRQVGSIVLPDGRRKSFYGKTRKEVQDAIKKAHGDVQRGEPVPIASETLAQFLDRFLTDVASQRVRATTLRDYRGDVRRHIAPALGKLRLHDLSVARAQRIVNDLDKSGLGGESIKHIRACLRVALTQSQREGLIAQNPAKLVIIPRIARQRVKALTPDDARALLAAFAGHPYEALVTLTLATGLRQGEVLGLAWSDIDLDVGTLSVSRQLQRIDKEYELNDLKTAMSRRTLALPRIAVEALRRHKAHQKAERLRLGPLWEDSGCVFTTATGGYLNGSTVTHAFQKQLAKAGLGRIKFHHLRHGAASLLLAQGAPMRVVMEQLGHSQISLTMNTYAHIAPQVMRDAADKLDAALGA